MRSPATRDYYKAASTASAKSSDVRERRRTGRICPELLGCNLGSITDVSPGGIRLATRRRLRGRRRVVLRREGDEGLLLHAAVRWSRRVGLFRHEAGLAFLRTDGEDASILRELALGS